MLAKFSVFLSSVPHFVLALALAVTIYAPQILAAIKGGPLDAWVPYVTGAAAFATGILALAKQFNPGTPQAAASDKAIVAKIVSKEAS
jgi:hypothetical protein